MARPTAAAHHTISAHDALYKLGDSIRENRRNAMKRHLDVAASIQKLIESFGLEEAHLFSQQLGITDQEFSLYQHLPTEEEAEFWQILRKSFAGTDTMKGMLADNGEILEITLAALKLGFSLEDGGLQRILTTASEAALGKEELKSRFWSFCFSSAADKVAKTAASSLKDAAGHLYAMLIAFQSEVDLIRRGDRLMTGWLDDEEELEPPQPDLARWEVERHAHVQDLAERRFQIAPVAAKVLSLFQELFPGSTLPMEDWVSIGNEDFSKRRLAECSYALTALAEGNFKTELPAVYSKYHSWSCLSSIGFLAGVTSAFHVPENDAPRPSRKLNALVISEATGVGALGISLANCIVTAAACRSPSSIETIEVNRPDWEVSRLSIEDSDLAQSVSEHRSSGARKSFQIVAGSLPSYSFRKLKKGAAQQNHLISRVLGIVSEANAKGFFFECDAELLQPSFTPCLHWVRKQIDQMGYISTAIPFNAVDFGLPQNRPRTVLIGLQPEYADRLRIPVLRKPIITSVGAAITDVAFPYLFETDSSWSDADWRSYRVWVDAWTKEFAEKRAVPDVISILKESKDHSNWYDVNGFLLDTDDVIKPSASPSPVRKIPLTVAVLKRLHGIPDDWVLTGSYSDQVKQVVESMPPAVARILTHMLHEAITGHSVDYDFIAREPIRSNHTKGPNQIRVGHAAQGDPATYAAREWRDFVRSRSEVCGDVHSWWDDSGTVV